MCVKVFERLCLFSGASDQRDLPLSQPARPSAVELRAAGGGAPLQSEYLQFAKVFGRTPHWMLLVTVRFCADAFGVFLTCSQANVLWVDPPALQANLSLLTSPVDDNFVSVTAVVGKNESEEAPADGILFSYVKGSLVKHKCEWLVVKTKISVLLQKYSTSSCALSVTRLCGLPACCCLCGREGSHPVQLQASVVVVQLRLTTCKVQTEEK